MNAFRTPSDAEREALVPIIAHAFGAPIKETPDWFERAGHRNLRAYFHEDSLAGGLVAIPMGQYFGGRSVPMVGVAGVGVSTEHRGHGTGTRMMSGLVRELHDEGVALSALYPATVPLYQRAGYERAGGRYAITLRPHDLSPAHDPALRVVSLASVGEGETGEVYARYARSRDGWLDRGPYIWLRLNKPYKGETRSFGVTGDQGLEGYVVVRHHQGEGHDTDLTALDLVAATPRAAREVLSILSAYRSLAQSVTWYGSPSDTWVHLLRDRFHEVKLQDFWMLRLTHVQRALHARGYNPSLRGALTLTVSDDVVPGNAGSWRVEVEDGQATVSRAVTDGLRLHVRALASLYSGFRSASDLVADGLATGDAPSVALADALFAGRAPAMSDGF